jgi:hypothetical protein
MESQRNQQLNPLALAIAAGATALILSLLVGLPMMGIGGGMMGGYSGGMMGGYSGGMMGGSVHPFVGFGAIWLVCVLIAALAGALLAWIYNAANAASSRSARAQEK